MVDADVSHNHLVCTHVNVRSPLASLAWTSSLENKPVCFQQQTEKTKQECLGKKKKKKKKKIGVFQVSALKKLGMVDRH